MLQKILIFLFLLVLNHQHLYAQNANIVKVHQNSDKIDLFHSMEILEDKKNTLTIDDMTKEEISRGFKPATVVGNSFGVTDSSFWVRFSIKVDKKVDDALYLELAFPLIDKVTLYIPNDDGSYETKISGEANALALKDIDYRNPLFMLPKSDRVKTYYMHVDGLSSIQIPLFLYQSVAFVEHVDSRNFLFGGYYGTMILLMIITFVAFLKLEDKIFLSYSIYMFSYLFFQLSINGFFIQYFSPSLIPLTYVNNSTLFSLAFVVVGGILFAGSFLKIWDGKYPKIRILFYLVMTAAVMGNILAYTVDYSFGVRMSTISGVLLPPTVLFAAIYTLLRGYEPAKYFLVAWLIFLFGIFLSGLLFLGILPHTFMTAYSMQLGSMFQVLLLAYALIDRVNTLYEEKEQATKKSEAYLAQLNKGLESLVSQRTKELEEKNELLRELSHKDSMTGLLNHNASIEQLESMKSAAVRYKYALAVMMIDIDLFKGINDKHGHRAGDEVIKQIVAVIKNNIRQSDSAGRYGGEEFIVMLHEMDEKGALNLAERMRTEIASLQIEEISNDEVTASFGVSIFDPKNAHTDIILEADKALYKAKQSGRNKVCFY